MKFSCYLSIISFRLAIYLIYFSIFDSYKVFCYRIWFTRSFEPHNILCSLSSRCKSSISLSLSTIFLFRSDSYFSCKLIRLIIIIFSFFYLSFSRSCFAFISFIYCPWLNLTLSISFAFFSLVFCKSFINVNLLSALFIFSSSRFF